MAHAQYSGFGDLSSQGSGYGNYGATGTVDCSDPLMATSPQCQGMYQESTGPMGIGMGSSPMSRGMAPAVPTNYTDTEQIKPPATDNSQNQSSAPPPLTEFQKFIASTTGTVLPIFGADLFRSVPSTYAPIQMAPVPPDYLIGPGDELRIRIWGQVNTQANVRVDRTGDIYIPQIGPIHVAGLPYSSLEDHVRDAVSRVFKNFSLTVDVGQIRSIQVYVTGAARRPGQYTVSALSTLVNAIFTCGGPASEGSMRRIELRRNGAVLTTFDLYQLLIGGNKSGDVKLADGDVIYIPPVGAQAAITGSVRMPGIYELLGSESVGSLIKDAGGATAMASGARISIERTSDRSDRQAMEVADDAVGLGVPLDDGDLVRLYPITASYQKTVTLRGNVANPGRFAWHAGMRILDLIPDKQSLLTRDYWWHRAQLGLPTPEFQPIPALGHLRQPTENEAAALPLQQQNTEQSGALNQAAQEAATQSALTQSGRPLSPEAEAALTREQTNPQTGQSLPAAERASSTSVAAEQSTLSTTTRPAAKPLEIKLPAPEIDWSYAVIERIDPQTLKTKLIPFDLGKLVLDHDPSQNLELEPGDIVTIFSEADIRIPLGEQTKLVRLEGEFVHSGIYTVRPGETLRDLVKRAGGFTPNAYLYGSEFTRESARVLQQSRIDEYVQRMNLSIQQGTLAMISSPAASAQDVASSNAAVGLERDLLATLKQIRASGRIVLQFKPGSEGVDSVPNMPLEDGDRFIVPPPPSTVNVVGAVYDQNAFLYEKNQRVGAYLHMAGGPDRNADSRHAFVVRADGEVISYAMAHGPWGNEFDNLRVYPGDAIVVPNKTLKPSVLRSILDFTQLTSQMMLGAVALAVILP